MSHRNFMDLEEEKISTCASKNLHRSADWFKKKLIIMLLLSAFKAWDDICNKERIQKDTFLVKDLKNYCETTAQELKRWFSPATKLPSSSSRQCVQM